MSRDWTDVEHVQQSLALVGTAAAQHLSDIEFKCVLEYIGRKLALPKQRQLHEQDNPRSDSGTLNLIVLSLTNFCKKPQCEMLFLTRVKVVAIIPTVRKGKMILLLN